MVLLLIFPQPLFNNVKTILRVQAVLCKNRQEAGFGLQVTGNKLACHSGAWLKIREAMKCRSNILI
jgi:hypothetical protein